MSQTPISVRQCVRLYRLLLVVYPRSFRQEYGAAMVQLFRDMALSTFLQKGRLGLLGMWPRVLRDALGSGLREHWENLRTDSEKLTQTDDALSMSSLLHRWAVLGWCAVAMLGLSVYYAGSLFYRRRGLCCAALCATAVGLWVWSCYGKIGQVSLWTSTDLSLTNGAVELRYVYEYGNPVPLSQWLADPASRDNMLPTPTAHEFTFSGGHPLHRDGAACKYCVLRFPVWVLPALLLVWAVLSRANRMEAAGGEAA